MRLNKPFATVTPTLDGDVLAILATHDVTFTTGQIHRILQEFSEEGIRKVLTRLVAQGVVIGDRVGNAFAYRLNSEHLAAGPIRELSRLSNTFLSCIESHLDSWEEAPVYAAVFGSAATGSMTLHSDIDLFLVRRDDAVEFAWEGQVQGLVAKVAGWTGNDARVVEYTVESLRAAKLEPLVREVADHGLTVAGTRAWFVKQIGMRSRGSNAR